MAMDMGNIHWMHAVEKSMEQQQKQVEHDMPTYINRAIWFRYDDETVERLVDRAVKEVVQLDQFWSDPQLVANIYDDDLFCLSVEEIFKVKFHFFDRFVKDHYKRELQLDSVIDEGQGKDNLSQTKKESEESTNEKLKDAKGDYDYIAYYKKKLKKEVLQEDDGNEEYKAHQVERDNNEYEYHIYPASMKDQIDKWINHEEKPIDLHELCKLRIEEDRGFEWTWWRRKTKGEVASKAKRNGIKTYGFWEILNDDKTNQENIKYNGVGIEDLNVVFALLRYYWDETKLTEPSTDQSRVIERKERKSDPTMLHVTYCQGDMSIPIKFEVDIFIHPDPKMHSNVLKTDAEFTMDGVNLYELNWWNRKARNQCNAISIRNKTSGVNVRKIKEKYYMRFCTQDVVDASMGVNWECYDNDTKAYKQFYDYQNARKVGLLHKQLEAIFQSNINTNYPWTFFERHDGYTRQPRGHSFNNAQVTHLRPALEDNGLFFDKIDSTKGHMLRFKRLYAPNDEVDHDRNIILNMEQITITAEFLFSRNIRRMKNGKNSLSSRSTTALIASWLQNYLLLRKTQRLYFWSFILCIAAKIKQIEIEIANQLVTIPHPEAFLSAKQNHDTLPIGALSKKLDNLSKTRILRKALVKAQGLKMSKEEEPDKFVWYQTSDGEQYRNSLGAMFRFGEIIRKFILEKKHLGDDTSLWPYYKNYFHRNDYQSYHALVNRFNMSLMFSRVDMFKLLEHEAIADINSNAGCCTHFSCADYDPKEGNKFAESGRMQSTELAIRHQRKVIAPLLLQSQDSLRNLNILRQQLCPLLKVVMERAGIEEEEYDEAQQKKNIRIAKEYNMETWRELIEISNKRLQDNLNNIETGWQLLTEYDIHKMESMEISLPQYPFFESFLKHFLLNTIEKETERVQLKTW
eukprot:156069_1